MAFTEKHLSTPGVIELAGRRLKRYHVSPTGNGIEPAIQEAAYAFLPKLLPELDETPPAGFVVLHRGGGAAYLTAFTWVWDNVIECRTAIAGQMFLGSPDEDPTHFTELDKPWIGCVWELPPLSHERSAWVRHMLAPARPDLNGYLADFLTDAMVGL